MKKRKDVAAFFIVTLLLVTLPLNAQITWYVDDDAANDPGPGDPSVSDPLEDGSTDHPFDAIQEGIDSASNGDTVMAADGTYTGNGNRDLDFSGKAITVSSENGPAGCIIDCEGGTGTHNGFNFQNGEGEDSVVQGFTIQNGFRSVGGGIYVGENTSPTIMDNIIENNFANGFDICGGGICSILGSPVIIGNEIRNNEAAFYGGGICCVGGFPVIEENIIIGNLAWYAGAGIYCHYSSAVISNNHITQNYCNEIWERGGGIGCIYWDDVEISIENNIVNGNAAQYGGGIYIEWIGKDKRQHIPPLVRNNIIINNSGDYGGGVYGYSIDIRNCTIVGNTVSAYGSGGGVHMGGIISNSIIWNNSPDQIDGSPSVNYSDIQGSYPGESNINSDPRFESGPLGDYYLLQPWDEIQTGDRFEPWGVPSDDLEFLYMHPVFSPCVNSGDPGSDMIEGTTCIDGRQDLGRVDMGYHYQPFTFH